MTTWSPRDGLPDFLEQLEPARQVLRRLESYERVFSDGTTTIVLKPDSDLLRYLDSPRDRR